MATERSFSKRPKLLQTSPLSSKWMKTPCSVWLPEIHTNLRQTTAHIGNKISFITLRPRPRKARSLTTRSLKNSLLPVDHVVLQVRVKLQHQIRSSKTKRRRFGRRCFLNQIPISCLTVKTELFKWRCQKALWVRCDPIIVSPLAIWPRKASSESNRAVPKALTATARCVRS